MITRRDTTRLLLGAAAALAMPTGLAAATREEWLGAMESALKSATVPGAGTELTLVGFDFAKTRSGAAMSAVVQMTWPPGIRRRPFTASEAGERETFIRLVGNIVAEFRAANPDGVREVRFS